MDCRKGWAENCNMSASLLSSQQPLSCTLVEMVTEIAGQEMGVRADIAGCKWNKTEGQSENRGTEIKKWEYRGLKRRGF